ncbi:MAG: hypothetical protein EPN99_06435 [Frankiales bacterium]|nr:MAG: hypothetical protein EPN99_06435 [Frankiales bacterium]
MRRLLLAALTAVAVLGATAAAAAPYPPPSNGEGKAAPSRVKQGHCTNFSGDGFAVGADITITDDDRKVGMTQTDDKGRFSSRICFATDARVGQHVLRGTGRSAATSGPEQHRVTAIVTVTGVEESGRGSDPETTPAASVGDLVTTPFGLSLLLLLVLPLISGPLLVLDRRHRARRRAS